MKQIPVVKLAEAATILGINTRAAESALRHAGIKSGYPQAAVEWLAANRPGAGSRTDLKKENTMRRVQIEFHTGTSTKQTGHGWVTVTDAAPPTDREAKWDWAREVVATRNGVAVDRVKLLSIYEGSDDVDAEDGLADANWQN